VTDSVAAEFESSILPQPAIGHNFEAVQSTSHLDNFTG